MKFAKLAGARGIAMDINEERLAYCLRWAPVDETINALNNPLDRLLELTQGELPTVVFEKVMQAMAAGHIDTDSYITHRCPLDAMIVESWLKPETGVIKAMVEL